MDFAGSVLERIGQSRHSVGNYLSDGSLLDIYEKSVMYLCSGDVGGVMWSGENSAVQIPGYMSMDSHLHTPLLGETYLMDQIQHSCSAFMRM